MSRFEDTPINEGTRKKTEYANERKSRLMLSIDRTDGGTMQVPILVDAKTTVEERKYQHNTLLAVTPLAQLPGYDQPGETLKGALPRPGRIYVFRQDKLWRELETDGQGRLFEVDVGHWRTIASEQGSADQREPVCVEQYLILVPMFLHGRFVGDQLSMAYSELPWTWEYIEWLESDAARVKARSQSLGGAWLVAARDTQDHQPSVSNPVIPVTALSKGLRARDFNIESALEDPAHFTPEFAAFSADALIVNLQQSKQELAEKLQHKLPPPLPEVQAGTDLLEQYRLRDHTRMVGVILKDPIFELRHTIARIRDCVDYLQTLNALVPHQPHGRYAQLLYSTLDGPIADFKVQVDLPALHAALFEQTREKYRDQLAQRLTTLVALLDKGLYTVLLDWACSCNEALLEPYSLMTEALHALNQLPGRSDAMYTGEGYAQLNTTINTFVNSLLRGQHPLGKLLLVADTDQLPDMINRLVTLRDSGQAPDPQAMGLSTLVLTAPSSNEVDYPGIAKAFAYFLADLLDNFGASVVAQLSRLSQGASNIHLDRLFAPAFNTLAALSPKMAGIKLMPMGKALAEDLVIIGVKGAGLNRGLTDNERQTLTRKSYRYATLHDSAGNSLGSTSQRGTDAAKRKLSDVTVVAVNKAHPDLAKYSQFRVHFGAATEALEKSKVVPTLMVGLATYNLFAQINALKNLRSADETIRGATGIASASLDLMAALGSHSKLLIGSQASNYLSAPRIDVNRISSQWAKNLQYQTGSPKLPLLRGFGGAATLFGALLSGWDSYRSLRDGDMDAAVAYGVTAAGGALWGAYALGLMTNPITLVIGVALVIGGMVAAYHFSDSELETVVKKGPFGLQHVKTSAIDPALIKGERYAHMQSPQSAYQQLLGTIGTPKIYALRLADWCKKAPEAHLKALQQADNDRSPLPNSYLLCPAPEKQALAGSDWAIVLSCPLLPMFENDQKFKLIIQEFLSAIRVDEPFAIKRYRRVAAPNPKLAAISLDTTSVLYVFPASLPVVQRSLRDRAYVRMTQGLKVSAQFELSTDQASERLILPQPNPNKWSAFTSANRALPADDLQPDEAPPYWKIEIIELTV